MDETIKIINPASTEVGISDAFNHGMFFFKMLASNKLISSIAKMLRSDPMSKYEVVGFIADEPDLAGKTIVGLPVYKNDDKLVDIIYKKNIEAVIISPAKHEDVQNTDFLNKM